MFESKAIKELIQKARENQLYEDHLFFDNKLKELSEKHTKSIIEISKKNNEKIQDIMNIYEERLKTVKIEKDNRIEELKIYFKNKEKETRNDCIEKIRIGNETSRENFKKEIEKNNKGVKEKLTQQNEKIKLLIDEVSFLKEKVKSYRRAYSFYEDLRSHLEKLSLTVFTSSEKLQIYSSEIYKQLAVINDAMETHTLLINKVKPKLKQMMNADHIFDDEIDQEKK